MTTLNMPLFIKGIHYIMHLDQSTFSAHVFGNSESVCAYAYPAGQCTKDLVSVDDRDMIDLNTSKLSLRYIYNY